MTEIDLRLLLQHAKMNHIFQERKGKVLHTADTKVPLDNGNVRNMVGLMIEEVSQGAGRVTIIVPTSAPMLNALKIIDAIDRFDQTKAPNECVCRISLFQAIF